MFRQRRPLRRFARGMRQPAGRAQKAFQNANQLMEKGDYQAAANIYHRLARGAHQRCMLRRAPHLYLRAACARLYATEIDEAQKLLYHGFNLMEDT